MLDTLRKRLRSEKGFTLIELLVVMIILAILTAIAIPSLPELQGPREQERGRRPTSARSIPSIESYFADNGTYAGMTVAGLQASYDQAINPRCILGDSTAAASNYCVQATVARHRPPRRPARRPRSSSARLPVSTTGIGTTERARETAPSRRLGRRHHPIQGSPRSDRTPIVAGQPSITPRKEPMHDHVAEAAEEREGLHPDRAPRRHDHPRDPDRDRDPVLPQLPGPREQERRRRRRALDRSRRSRRTSPTTARTTA